MGRRFISARPTVINTELIPFDESFYILADGQLEQWYYENSNRYAPNRALAPLTLTPVIEAVDKETGVKYNPAFYTTQWIVKEYDSTQGDYVETIVSNAVDSDNEPYVLAGNSLKVKRNVSWLHAVTITCVATYIDPRDAGITYTVRESVTLTTNHDASVVHPDLEFLCPVAQTFNPLTAATSQFTLEGKATREGVDITSDVVFVWKAVSGNTEVPIENMPWYVSGQGTTQVVVDAMYGDNIRVVLRAKESAAAQDLFPSRAQADIVWNVPNVDVIVASYQGSAVRSNTADMRFGTICNVKGGVLSEEVKAMHLMFNWVTRKSNGTTETDAGWGQEVTIPANVLRNVYGAGNSLASSVVNVYAYLLGPYEEVIDDGEALTDDSEAVIDRFI